MCSLPKVSDYERYFRAYEQLTPLHDAATKPVAVLVAGVPGVGKSTLAEGLARALIAPVFSMDWQLGALTPFKVLTNDNVGPLAEMMLVGAVARQLQLGLDVVIDATGHEEEARRRYRAVAEGLGAGFVGVECVCSDETAHRTRIEGRDRGIPGWHGTVPWEHVQRMKSPWEAWGDPHPLVDSATTSVEQALALVLKEVAETRHPQA
jgi:predicted kinase